ncbi:hypothetical protein ACE01N_08645 [Saccharicrinis sp. FJH2]|uniref:hypothetical protein n=1 Tax=Saccharicrinis sp. FJH65 TaxID=3344659 RepID=UPI0035F361CB
MTKFFSICVIALSLVLSVNAQKLSKMPPKVVLIGIGAKNPTFNEAQYPHLKIYYTPELTPVKNATETQNAAASLSGAVKFTYDGQPEFLKNIWNDKNIDEAFMLFDKNGLCVAQGYDVDKQGDIASRLCTDKKPLADHIKDCVKKGKTGKAEKKEMKLKKSDFMVGYSFPEFNLSDTDGNSTTISEVLNGEPTLVIFFNIPDNMDLNAAKESGEGKSGKAFLKSMVSGAAGAGKSGVFLALESQVYDYDAREK